MNSNKNQKLTHTQSAVGDIEKSLISEYLFQTSFFLNLTAIMILSEGSENSVEHLVLEQKYEDVEGLKVELFDDFSKKQICLGKVDHDSFFNQGKYHLPKHNLSYILLPIEGKAFQSSKKILAVFKSESTNFHEIIFEIGKLCEKLNNISYDNGTKGNLKLHLGNLEMLLNKKIIDLNNFSKKYTQLEEESVAKNHLLQIFFRNFFHDLVNPLSILSMCVEFLEDQIVDESALKMIERMENSTKLMAQIIKRNRDIQKLLTTTGQAAKEKFTLDDIGSEVQKTFGDQLTSKKINVQIAATNKGSDFIFVDRAGFSSFVLYNIFSNAIKYSLEGSKIIFGIKKEANKNFFFVKDFGIGIPENVMLTIFSGEKKQSRIGTNGEAGQGTGLLWMKHYLDKNAQELKIHSKESTDTQDTKETEFKIAI